MTTRLLVGEIVEVLDAGKNRHHSMPRSNGEAEVGEALLMFVAGSEFDFSGHVEGENCSIRWQRVFTAHSPLFRGEEVGYTRNLVGISEICSFSRVCADFHVKIRHSVPSVKPSPFCKPLFLTFCCHSDYQQEMSLFATLITCDYAIVLLCLSSTILRYEHTRPSKRIFALRVHPARNIAPFDT